MSRSQDPDIDYQSSEHKEVKPVEFSPKQEEPAENFSGDDNQSTSENRIAGKDEPCANRED